MKRLSRFALVLFAGSILSVEAETIVGLTSDNKLQFFSSFFPGTLTKTVNITGIPAAESGAALDFRTDAVLVVLTRQGTTLRPYLVDPNTGAAVSTPFTEVATTATGVAFDATSPEAQFLDLVLTTEADRMRRFFVSPSDSGSGVNQTLAFDNSATDGDPVDRNAGADPTIVALASTNSFVGAKASVLYGIDSGGNSLVKIDPANASIDTIATLRDQGGTAVGITPRTGFDISGASGIAYLMVGSRDTTSLLTVNLTTGVTTDVGEIGPAAQEPDLVDITTQPPTRLVNLSTRSRVGAGEDVMIAGFISQGATTSRLIIRGIGPSLGAVGVANPLADPVLTIFDGNGLQFATNDNWKSGQKSQVEANGLAPSNDLEAAFFGSFPPGQYTAIVSGKDGGTGVGLVEIYKLPDL